MNDKHELFEMMMENNLNWIAIFHNHAQFIFSDKKNDLQLLNDLTKNQKHYWDNVYTNEFPYKITETSFLLMFGYLEEMLHLLHAEFNPYKTSLDTRNNGFSKYKPYISSLIDISSSESYQLLTDAQKIRNSILHIGGRISLSKDKLHIENILKNSDSFSKQSDRVVITRKGLQATQKAIRDITQSLCTEANKIVP